MYDGNEGRTRAGADGKEKERKLRFLSPSHHSFRLFSLTINSTTWDNAGEGRGGGGYTWAINHVG